MPVSFRSSSVSLIPFSSNPKPPQGGFTYQWRVYEYFDYWRHGFSRIPRVGRIVERWAQRIQPWIAPAPPDGLFPQEVEIHLGNLEEMTDEELVSLFVGKNVLVFAAGVDDRVTPRKPAYPYFKKHNVDSVKRVFTLARQAGVKRGVVLGSYFAYFERIWPELKLAEKHPYIRSRVEQTRAAFEAGQEEMSISVLELPYIFGSIPGRIPLWKPLLDYAFSPNLLFYPAGGTTCVTVHQVARAICGAVEKGRADIVTQLAART